CPVPPRRHYGLLRDRLLREEFVDLQFLTFDARLVAAAARIFGSGVREGVSVPKRTGVRAPVP
ncbi:MAG: hypothetical protein M3283_03830, partial [Actinomycetota bacterium]|nr:hypothetical protein [Actinomycetota bacterium]